MSDNVKSTRKNGATRTIGKGESPATGQPDIPLEVRGLSMPKSGNCTLLVTRPGASLDSALSVPLAYLADGKHALLQEFLLKHGRLDIAKTYAPREISSFLSYAAQVCQAIAIDQDGLHDIQVLEKSHRIYVKGGQCHWITQKPEGAEIVLVGAAAVVCKPTKSLVQFNDGFAKLLTANPRVLAVLCFALASLLARLFGVPQLNLGIIGISSRGKSIVQKSASCVVNGRDEVLAMDATVAGLHEYLADRSDQAVFIDDAHGARAAEALNQSLMNTGNSGGRLTSTRAQAGAAHQPLACSLIFSAERAFTETARAGRIELNSGVFARTFELHLGQHGMFDDLGSFADAATLAKFIQTESPHYLGIVGSALLQQVTGSWLKAQALWPKHEAVIHAQILKHAEADEVTGLNGRLLDRLTFITFVGCLLVHFKILEISKKDIYRAVGLLFKEHLSRLNASTSPVAGAVADAVRHFIQTHQGSFLPLVQAGDATQPNNLAGYLKRGSHGDQVYLFFPGVFKAKFIDKFGAEAYGHLRDAGFLVTQPSRGNLMTVRVKLSGQDEGKRQDFVAISSTILYSENTG